MVRHVGRYFDGFLDLSPNYTPPCELCGKEDSMFYDIDQHQNICLDCCDELWFAKNEMVIMGIYVDRWTAS
ncbi:MAG: hypothetical protein RJA41_733 [Actinomycetota bacterium]|jgi:hypothetical protein